MARKGKCPDCGSKDIVVTVYKANYSAFNGYRKTPSSYSEIHCKHCRSFWRTKAAYADSLPRILTEELLRRSTFY